MPKATYLQCSDAIQTVNAASAKSKQDPRKLRAIYFSPHGDHSSYVQSTFDVSKARQFLIVH